METALVPFESLQKMAGVLGRQKLFGMTADELLPLMLIAQAEGKHPASAAQEYDIIQGRPALRSRAALARFQAAGGRIEWLKRDPIEARATLSHPAGGSLTVSWTIDRAKKAGLAGKDNWQKYPEAMLSARVIAEGVRAVYPGCLSGMYLGEEVQDFGPLPQQPERNVTEEPPEPAAEDPEPAAPDLTLEPDPIEAAPVADIRMELAALAREPLLVEEGKALIAQALADPNASAATLQDLVARSNRALAKARAGRGK